MPHAHGAGSMLCTSPVLCSFGDRSTLVGERASQYGLRASWSLAADMAQDTQQQNGVRDTASSGDAAKLHLPTGEVIELPMLVVRCVVRSSQLLARDKSILKS